MAEKLINLLTKLAEEFEDYAAVIDGEGYEGKAGLIRQTITTLNNIPPDGDEVVISKQSLKDLLLLAKDYTSRRHFSQQAYDRFAAAVAEGKEKLGVK